MRMPFLMKTILAVSIAKRFRATNEYTANMQYITLDYLTILYQSEP